MCDVNAYCENTIGSYDCVCVDGYIKNGTFCMSKLHENSVGLYVLLPISDLRGDHPIAFSGKPNPSKRQSHLHVGILYMKPSLENLVMMTVVL